MQLLPAPVSCLVQWSHGCQDQHSTHLRCPCCVHQCKAAATLQHQLRWILEVKDVRRVPVGCRVDVALCGTAYHKMAAPCMAGRHRLLCCGAMPGCLEAVPCTRPPYAVEAGRCVSGPWPEWAQRMWQCNASFAARTAVCMLSAAVLYSQRIVNEAQLPAIHSPPATHTAHSPRLIFTTGSLNSSRSCVSLLQSATTTSRSPSSTAATLPSSSRTSSSAAMTRLPLPPQAARLVPSGDQHSPSREPEEGRTCRTAKHGQNLVKHGQSRVQS